MSVSVSFAADFTKLNSAIDGAVVKFRSFETQTSKVEKQLTGMGNSFSGQKIIQQALLASAAIEKLEQDAADSGKAFALTGSEMQRAGNLAKEAAEKMRALGMDVPERLQKLVKAIEPLPQQLTLTQKASAALTSTFGQMTAAFGAANLIQKGVGALISFGKAALEDAGHIVDLSQKTGIGTQALQQMQYAAIQSGDSLDSMTSAAFKLGVKMSTGSGSVREAVDELGLSFAQLRNAKPEAQFESIVGALGKMTDVQERNRLGVELFGKSFEGIAATVSAGYADMAAAAPKMSDAQIRAASAAGDAWDRMVGKITKGTGQVLGNFAIISEEIGKMFQGQGATTDAGIGGVIGALDRASKRARGEIAEPAFIGPPASTKKAVLDYVEALKKADDAVAKLTKEQKAQIDAATKLGTSTEKLADETGIAELVIKRYTSSTKESTKATKDNEAALKKQHQALEDFQEDFASVEIAIDKLVDKQQELDDKEFWASGIKDMKETHDLFQKLLDDADDFNKALNPSSEQQAKNMAGITGGPTGISAPPVKLLSSFEKGIDSLAEAFSRLATISQGTWGGIVKDLARVVGAMDLANKAGNQFQEGGIGNKAAGIIGGIAAVDSATSSGSRLSRVGGGAAAGQAIGNKIVPVIGGWVGGIAGAIVGIFRGDSKGQQLNKGRDAAIKQITGVNGSKGVQQDAFRKMATDAGASREELDKLFSTHNLDEFNAGLEKITAKLQAQKDLFEKYNVTWKDFEGTKQADLFGKELQQLVGDTKALETAGLSHEAALRKTADAYVDLAMQAVTAFGEIPEAMAPTLLELAKMGSITEANAAKLLGLTDANVVDFKAMEEAANKYGIKLESLGSKFLGAKLSDAAQTLLDDFNLLTTNGGDLNAVIGGMSKEVQRVVDQAIHMGLAVPASMRDMLQKFVDSGALVDDNGDKLKDLSMINFAEPIESAIQRLIDKLNDFIDKLGEAGSAINGLPSVPEGGGGGGTGDGTADGGQQARGGFYRVSGPTKFLAGEKGPEDVLFSGANRTIKFPSSGNAGGSGSAAATIDLSGVEDRLDRLARDNRRSDARWAAAFFPLIGKAS